MDIHEIRRTNVRHLIDTVFDGNATQLAQAIKKQPSEIYRRLNTGKESRNFGASFCRAIEKAAGKPTGWTDVPHDYNNEDLEEILALVKQLPITYRNNLRDSLRAILSADKSLSRLGKGISLLHPPESPNHDSYIETVEQDMKDKKSPKKTS